MLVLSRKEGERICIGQNIVLTISEVRGNRVRIGFEAPPEVAIHREEVRRHDEMQRSMPKRLIFEDAAPAGSRSMAEFA